MKNKKGFISTSIVYAFFLVFILLLIAMFMSFANKRFLIKKIIENSEFPGSDMVISCKEGDKLSECLFIAEHKEAEALYQKWLTYGMESLSENEKNQWRAIGRFSTWEGFIDLSLDRKKILNDLKTAAVRKGVPDSFRSTYERGMYAYEDDFDKSYYYNGAEDDNFVLFADKLWSIVRINGDGSIRLVYQGEWDEINSVVGGVPAKKNYIKKTSYIDINGDGNKTSNDARHYNVNDTEEFIFNIANVIYPLNKEKIDICCTDKEANDVECSLFDYALCDLRIPISDSLLYKIQNYGDSSSHGSKSLYNAGFMSNSKNAWGDTQAKLSNSAPSTIMTFLHSWYRVNIEPYEEFIHKDALFCANKDVVLEEDSDYFLADEYCYCYGDDSTKTGWANNILKLDTGLFNYCSNTVGTGQCKNNGFVDGLQLNYHLNTTISTVRNSMSHGLKCLGLANSSFSVNTEGATKIDYPVGLLTASEIILAGASYREESSGFYLATDYNYWTSDLAFGNNNNTYLSTYYFAYIGDKDLTNDSLNTKNHVLDVLDDHAKNGVAHIKPVINLKANIKYKDGNGTIETPYEIEV